MHELAVAGLVGSGVGTALGAPMAWPGARRTRDAKLLGAMLILASAIAALISARLAGLLTAGAAVDHAINLLGLTALPVAVLYVFHDGTDAAPFPHATLLWGPVAVYFGLAVARAGLGIDTRVPFVWLLPVVLGFTALSIASLSRPSGPVEGLVPRKWLVAFLVALNVSQILRMTFGPVVPVRAIVPLVLSTGFVALVALVAWRTVSGAVNDAEAARPPAPPRYARSGLDADEAREMLARIDRALTHDRLFARPDLTLAQLAAAAGCSSHQLSEALNRYAGTSFRDLLQRKRVDDVKTELGKADSDRFTIEGIGASAGFGSRSALHAAFRRLEGTTPAEYRASLRRR